MRRDCRYTVRVQYLVYVHKHKVVYDILDNVNVIEKSYAKLHRAVLLDYDTACIVKMKNETDAMLDVCEMIRASVRNKKVR